MHISLTTHTDVWAKGQVHFRAQPIRDLKHLGELICRYAYSPILFRNSYRKQDNFNSADLLVLDFDSGDRSIERAKEFFQALGYQFVIGTTRNHQVLKDGKIADRYRVLIPTSLTITDSECFRANMTKFISTFGADNACKDGGRMYYPCTSIFAVHEVGQPAAWDLSMRPQESSYNATEHRVYLESCGRAGVIPKNLLRYAEESGTPGSRNSAAFKISCQLYHLGLSLEAAIAWIMATPLGSLKLLEVQSVVRSAYKRVKADLGSEQRNGAKTAPLLKPDAGV